MSQTYHHEYPVHEVHIWVKDLTENNTYFDRIIAAPSDGDRQIQWAMWLSTTVFSSLIVGVVLFAVLFNERTRKKSFNLYLILLMIPDFLLSFICFFNCLTNIAANDFFSERSCQLQSFYCVWFLGANAWINAIVAYHMHQLLRCASSRQAYTPPSQRGVLTSCCLAYAWSLFVATWIFIDAIPHKTGLLAGIACLPVAYDRQSLLFYYVVYVPCFALIPILYAIYVWASVVWNKLLPKEGKARDLAMCFFRVILVFVLMWLPCIILLFGASAFVDPWYVAIGGFYSHFQGGVSALVSMMKPDVRHAVLTLIGCYRNKDIPPIMDNDLSSTTKKCSGKLDESSDDHSHAVCSMESGTIVITDTARPDTIVVTSNEPQQPPSLQHSSQSPPAADDQPIKERPDTKLPSKSILASEIWDSDDDVRAILQRRVLEQRRVATEKCRALDHGASNARFSTTSSDQRLGKLSPTTGINESEQPPLGTSSSTLFASSLSRPYRKSLCTADWESDIKHGSPSNNLLE